MRPNDSTIQSITKSTIRNIETKIASAILRNQKPEIRNLLTITNALNFSTHQLINFSTTNQLINQ